MKKSAKRSNASADRIANGSADVPKGMKALSGSFAPTWDPAKVGTLDGTFGPIKTVPLKQGNKTQDRRCVEFKTQGGERFTVWESAGLRTLFDEVKPGTRVFIKYEGLGQAKRGQNAPKRFLVAVAD